MFKNCCDDGETMPQYFLQVCTRRVIKCLPRALPTIDATHSTTTRARRHLVQGTTPPIGTSLRDRAPSWVCPSIAKKLSCCLTKTSDAVLSLSTSDPTTCQSITEARCVSDINARTKGMLTMAQFLGRLFLTAFEDAYVEFALNATRKSLSKRKATWILVLLSPFNNTPLAGSLQVVVQRLTAAGAVAAVPRGTLPAGDPDGCSRPPGCDFGMKRWLVFSRHKLPRPWVWAY